jgi:hypothetical protein
MAILYKKGGKFIPYKKKKAKSKADKEAETENKKNALSEYSKKLNHRSTDYQLDKVPLIQTR